MNYQLEYHPNQNCLSIHINIELTNEMIESFDSPKSVRGKQKKIITDIFAIDGIKGISLYRYELHLVKGDVFDWEGIIPNVVMTLLLHFCPNEKAEEVAKPKQYKIDENGYSRDIPSSNQEDLHEYSLSNVDDLIKK